MRIATEETRALVVNAYNAGTASREQLAKIFGYHLNSIGRWIRESRQSNRLAPLARGHRPPMFSQGELEDICRFIDENPDATLGEIKEHFNKACSVAAISKIVIKLGYTVKKNPAGKRARQRGCPEKQGRVERVPKRGAWGELGVP